MFTEAKLFQILDSSVKDISRKVAKIEVANQTDIDEIPALRPCSVYTKTKGDYDLSFVLRADYCVMEEITRNMKHGAEVVDQEDVKLYIQEFLNILFGHIVSKMNQSIHLKVFFDIPNFICGVYEKPKDKPVKFQGKYYYESPFGALELETVYNE